MLQRSPSYVMSLPRKDPLANLANGSSARSAVTRSHGARTSPSRPVLQVLPALPEAARRLIRRLTVKQLPEGYPVDEHFRPRYDPWDQRLCVVPGGDLFRAIRDGQADRHRPHRDIHPDRHPLASGRELEADIVVTATGLGCCRSAGSPSPSTANRSNSPTPSPTRE